MQDNDNKRLYLTIADLSTMGIAMVLCIVLGLFAGIWLDGRFETAPLFTLALLFGGIIAGFRIMYKTFVRFFREDNSGDADR